jgi:serine/threonine protein kinase
VDEAVGAVAEVAATLAGLAEEAGVHHRDLKPENLFRYQTGGSLVTSVS